MNKEKMIELEEYLNNLSDEERDEIINSTTTYIINELEKEKQLTS